MSGLKAMPSGRDWAVGLAILLALQATDADAITRRVPSQYPTIAAGLAAAVAGDTVLVACGTYHEHSLIAKSGVTIMSEGGDPACVVVDGDSLGRVITCSGVDASTRFERLTIRGGHVAGYGVFFWGGGMLCNDGSSPVIEDCVFEDNVSDFGYAGGLGCVDASPTVTSCVFRRTAASVGGAAACLRSSAHFANCTFEANRAYDYAGAIFAEDSKIIIMSSQFLSNTAGLAGGGVRFQGCNPELYECLFEDNVGGHDAGAMYCYSLASPSVSRCVYRGNSTIGSGGAIQIRGSSSPSFTEVIFDGNQGGVGGAISVRDNSSPHFEGCVFANNSASRGGAVNCSNNANPTLSNCTIARNSATTGGAAIASSDCTPVLERCIVAFQTAGLVFHCFMSSAAFPELHCCDLFGNYGGDWVGTCVEPWQGLDGNFSADPLFCDIETGYYSLELRSPCLPGQHPEGYDCGLIGAFDRGCGATAVEPRTWGAVKATFH